MTVEELLAQVVTLLQQEGRLSYRLLKRRFGIDDEYLEDLKAELIDAKRLAVDEDGKVLVWVGEGINGEQESVEETGKWGKGEKEEERLASRVQSLESKTADVPAARRQTLDPRPISYTPKHLAEKI